jgi:hypothetical protein
MKIIIALIAWVAFVAFVLLFMAGAKKVDPNLKPGDEFVSQDR